MTPDAIFMADLHLDDRQPPCRTDNYLLTEVSKLDQIRDLQDRYGGIPVFCSGDFFEKWNPRIFLIASALENLPDPLYGIPGNHDLPAHNIDRLAESGLGLLESCGAVEILRGLGKEFEKMFVQGFHYGYDFEEIETPITRKRKIAMIHEFTYMGRAPFPGASGRVTGRVGTFEDYDVVLCGDNHQPFTYEKDGTLFVNPGSVTRHKADQINHRPRVYLYYAKTNTVEPHFLDIDPHCVVRDHIDLPKETSARIASFIDMLQGNFESGLSFENNLKEFLNQNKIEKGITKKIMEAVNG